MTYRELLNSIQISAQNNKQILDQTVTVRVDASEYMPIIWHTIIYNNDILVDGHLVLTRQSEIKGDYTC